MKRSLLVSLFCFLGLLGACTGESGPLVEDELSSASQPLVASTPSPLTDDIKPMPAAQKGEAASLVTTSIVVPILLVPQGSSINTVTQTAVTQALGNVRRWYQRELPNKNVKWAELQVMQGDLTYSQYLANDTVWSAMPGEIQAKLGWNPWATGDTQRIALVLGKDLQGWAGGAGSGSNGLAILGLESLIDFSFCDGIRGRDHANPEENQIWWCNQTVWHGTAIHELGHAFSLPHDTDPSSIMSFHGDYTNKHFVAAHAATVETSPATEAKQANWSQCGIDYQCATKRCGGNGGNKLYCLPSSAYPKFAASIPDGSLCRSNSECLGGRCEMIWNGDKMCRNFLWPASFFPDVP